MDNASGLIVQLLILLVFYGYFAYSLQVMANKVGLANSWLAWIPVVNTFLLLQIAQKPLWWFILLFIPLVNIAIIIMVWIAAAKRLGHSTLTGVLVAIFPFLIGILAFSKPSSPSSMPPTAPAM
jgi:hypothetical protein